MATGTASAHGLLKAAEDFVFPKITSALPLAAWTGLMVSQVPELTFPPVTHEHIIDANVKSHTLTMHLFY